VLLYRSTSTSYVEVVEFDGRNKSTQIDQSTDRLALSFRREMEPSRA
jgi:hypothetical protein